MLGRKHVSACKAAIYISESKFELKKRLAKKMNDQHQLENVLCEWANSPYQSKAQHQLSFIKRKKCFGFAIHV